MVKVQLNMLKTGPNTKHGKLNLQAFKSPPVKKKIDQPINPGHAGTPSFSAIKTP